MADNFYTIQQAMDKLQKSEQEVQDLVKQGQLRQYMDNGKPMFKKEDIDSLSEEMVGLDISGIDLASEDSAPDLQLEETSPNLELEETSPDLELEETSPDLELEETSPDLHLEETSQIELEPDESGSPPMSEKDMEAEELKSEGGFGLSQMGDLSSADTNVGTVGINILSGTEDAFKLTEDSKAETRAEDEPEVEELEKLDADSNMESFGSGSGLLDLSLQADDTSLGAVLDDILPTGAEEGTPEGGELPVDQIGLADESEDLLAEPAMPAAGGTAQAPAIAEPTAPASAPAPGVAFVPVAEVDPRTNLFGIAMFLPLTAVIVAGIILTAATRGIRPSLLNLMIQTEYFGAALFWYILGGLALFAVIFSLFASVGGGSGQAKAKKVKVKKEKKKKRK